MPIYEYVCQDCGHAFDALQKMSDAPLIICPGCAAPRLKKKVSAPSFRLSGSGWYETDFKSANKRNVVDSDSKASDSAVKKEPDAGAKKASSEPVKQKPVTSNSAASPK